jgi:GNAT superfamily N-acetyltransferase
MERALESASIAERAARARPGGLRLREFDDSLAREFHDINAQWITTMFALEDADREVLEAPRAKIVDPGGVILFAEAPGLGIVGTCALRKTGGSGVELTKMGVRESARGLKAGEFLLDAAIARARKMGADPLYLLTNTKCAAAIHLYEKLGFVHDAEIMARYGARYARCDVAMRYRGRARRR